VNHPAPAKVRAEVTHLVTAKVILTATAMQYMEHFTHIILKISKPPAVLEASPSLRVENNPPPIVEANSPPAAEISY
jgi:hypothetical protein